MESKVFLFVRKTGVAGTNIIEIDRKEAMKFVRENRKSNFQVGILMGNSYDDILDVYGEYAPLRKVNNLKEAREKI